MIDFRLSVKYANFRLFGDETCKFVMFVYTRCLSHENSMESHGLVKCEMWVFAPFSFAHTLLTVMTDDSASTRLCGAVRSNAEINSTFSDHSNWRCTFTLHTILSVLGNRHADGLLLQTNPILLTRCDMPPHILAARYRPIVADSSQAHISANGSCSSDGEAI